MIEVATTSLEQFALTLYDIGAVQIGKFRLHSGRRSRIYLDLRILISYPEVLQQAAYVYRSILDDLQFDLIAAPPLAGLPLGTAVSLNMDIPMIFPRKTAKSYGTGKEIEGKWKVGQKAVIIDDVVTSGDSIIQAIVPLKAAGLHVTDAVVLIDRQQGGAQTLAGNHYNLHAAMTISELLAYLESNERISSKERAKVLESLQ